MVLAGCPAHRKVARKGTGQPEPASSSLLMGVLVRYKAWRSRKHSSLSARLDAMRVVPSAEDELRSHLDSGEKLVWAGRPAQGIVLRVTRQDAYVFIPLVAVWQYIA